MGSLLPRSIATSNNNREPRESIHPSRPYPETKGEEASAGARDRQSAREANLIIAENYSKYKSIRNKVNKLVQDDHNAHREKLLNSF